MIDLIQLLDGDDDARMKLLDIAAVMLIRGRGEDIPAEVKKWLGYGLLGMSSGRDFNDSFDVRRKKKENAPLHAYRYALVQREIRANNCSQEKAFEAVAARETLWRNEPFTDARRLVGVTPDGRHKKYIDAETIKKSFKKQQKIQMELEKRISELRKNRDL